MQYNESEGRIDRLDMAHTIFILLHTLFTVTAFIAGWITIPALKKG